MPAPRTPTHHHWYSCDVVCVVRAVSHLDTKLLGFVFTVNTVTVVPHGTCGGTGHVCRLHPRILYPLEYYYSTGSTISMEQALFCRLVDNSVQVHTYCDVKKK